MNVYAIGKPGERVSRYSRNLGVVALQADEVALLVTAVEVDEESIPQIEQIISANGTEILPYQPPLTEAKRVRLADAAAYRDQRQGAGCMTGLGKVDTDFGRSIPIINSFASAAGAAIAAKTAYGTKKFTLSDGTEVSIGATQGAALGIAVNAFLDQCQQAYRAAKAKIMAATTAEAVAAIDITAGYPA